MGERCHYMCPTPKERQIGDVWTCPRCGTEWVLEAYEDHFVGVDPLASGRERPNRDEH